MVSKKNEDKKKRAATTAAAPAKKAVPAKKVTAARKVVPAKKTAPAGKVGSTTRRKAGHLAVDGTRDCCEQLSREIKKLRKELRDLLKASRPAAAQRSLVTPLTLAGTLPSLDDLLGVTEVCVVGNQVTFTFSDGVTATLSELAEMRGRILLELRLGGTDAEPLSLDSDRKAALVQLFRFLTQNAGYVNVMGGCATC